MVVLDVVVWGGARVADPRSRWLLLRFKVPCLTKKTGKLISEILLFHIALKMVRFVKK